MPADKVQTVVVVGKGLGDIGRHDRCESLSPLSTGART